MINLKVLSTAAVMALVLPTVVATASFAQNMNGARGNVAASGGMRAGGGGAPHMGGGGGPRMGGGAVPNGVGGGPRMGGGGVHIGGGGAPGPRYSGGGGGYGGYHRHGGGGFIPGAVAGAVIGGAIASQSYGYYGGPGYYAPGYYDDQYYDEGAAVAVVPEGGDDAGYCAQRFRSYDPASGTYLGNDGYRHPCP